MSVERAAGHLIELAALAALLAAPLGTVPGILAAFAALTAVTVTYFGVLRPRLVRWGATDEEVAWPMPGDDIAAPGGRCTTRAITIGVPASQVWPWIAQLGYGRVGWYSDRLSHAGRQRSAAQIRPEWQQLGPGDRILLDAGFRLGRHRCRRRPLLRRAHPGRDQVMVLGGGAGRSPQLPADQPVARQVARHCRKRPVDRAV